MQAIHKKRVLFRQFKKAKKNNHSNWKELHNKFKAQRNYVTKISRQNRRENLIRDLKKKSANNNLRGIWKTIKHATNIQSSEANSPQHNIELDPKTANDYFTNVGAKIHADIHANSNNINDFESYLGQPNVPSDSFNTFNIVSKDDILAYVATLPSNKSINDLMPLKVYQNILPAVIEPVTYIVNLSLQYGTMPDLCKLAKLIPVFKEGDRSDLEDYRSISLLPLLGKNY